MIESQERGLIDEGTVSLKIIEAMGLLMTSSMPISDAHDWFVHPLDLQQRKRIGNQIDFALRAKQLELSQILNPDEALLVSQLFFPSEETHQYLRNQREALEREVRSGEVKRLLIGPLMKIADQCHLQY